MGSDGLGDLQSVQTAPTTASRTSRHRNKAVWMLAQKLFKLTARTFTVEHNDAFRRCRANLKRVLCKVDGQNANLSHGCFLSIELTFHKTSLAHCDAAVGGSIHPMNFEKVILTVNIYRSTIVFALWIVV